ncbi:MAG: alpha/beta fold hydrolase [Gammaproteobacteria bacterium]|nr:alpha/beta fold hydrolase [Gammaproteobacteria bacterium]
MPYVSTDDDVKLYYEEAGAGEPLVFVHEFAGDHRSWEPQLRHFSRRFRTIAYNARGYPPSDVPAEAERYSQDRARLDLLAVLDGLKIQRAHVCGLSMGGFATLHFGLHHPDRALSLVVAGCGYGAEPDRREQFQAEAEATARLVEKGSAEDFTNAYSLGPTRVQFQNQDPRGWAEFRQQLSEHSLLGAANTLRGVQKSRPSLYELEAGLREIRVPTLVITGDEDDPCLLPNVFLKRVIPSSALVVLPNAGHTINLEAVAAFNTAVEQFLTQVQSGRWPMRDPRSTTGSILGLSGSS